MAPVSKQSQVDQSTLTKISLQKGTHTAKSMLKVKEILEHRQVESKETCPIFYLHYESNSKHSFKKLHFHRKSLPLPCCDDDLHVFVHDIMLNDSNLLCPGAWVPGDLDAVEVPLLFVVVE